MRSTRGLLLLAIAGILGGVAATYYHQRKIQIRQAPAPPPALPPGVGAAAQDWQWSRNIGSRPGVEVRAGNFRHLENPERIELERVELRLYHKDGRVFDQVRCAHAVFDPAKAALYSDGEVLITMGLRPEEPQGRLVMIRGSGVTFHSETGLATTERFAQFTFDQGSGSADSATYDPAARELRLRGRVELFWRGRSPGSQPMKLEAGELLYKEADSLILLSSSARLTRGNAVLEATDAIVTLENGLIRHVEANQARGWDQEPGRRLEYSAEKLWMSYTAAGELEKLTAEGQARLVALTEESRATAVAQRLDLEFEARPRATILKRALATGGAGVESVPLPRPGVAVGETHRLESEVIQVLMRAGGREVERVQTESPGKLEMLPNRAGQRRRVLEAERLAIQYGEGGRVRSLRAVGVATRTDPEPARSGAAEGPPLETWSRDLLAEFDPKTGALERWEQWNDFRYREGSRQARAQRAVLRQSEARLILEGAARAWDATGSISAEYLELDRKTGDVQARGRVASSHLPDRKGSSSKLLSQEESLEAQADRMVTSERRQKVYYEGRVLMWQRANRLRAQRVEIDRRERRLTAEGEVVSEFADEPSGEAGRKGGGRPRFVVVQAARLVYTEQDRLAHYTGGVRLERGNLEIRASELRAFLSESGKDSSLERAIAEGGVQVFAADSGRTRRAVSEHAEYYVPAERVVLEGGRPELVDSGRGRIRGARLTWLIRDDSFQAEGTGDQPVLSRVHKP